MVVDFDVSHFCTTLSPYFVPALSRSIVRIVRWFDQRICVNQNEISKLNLSAPNDFYPHVHFIAYLPLIGHKIENTNFCSRFSKRSLRIHRKLSRFVPLGDQWVNKQWKLFKWITFSYARARVAYIAWIQQYNWIFVELAFINHFAWPNENIAYSHIWRGVCTNNIADQMEFNLFNLCIKGD